MSTASAIPSILDTIRRGDCLTASRFRHAYAYPADPRYPHIAGIVCREVLGSDCTRVREFVAGTRATIWHRKGPCTYQPERDKIYMPARKRFESDQAYYSTLFHELIHWTGHATRLDRAEISKPNKEREFRSLSYAYEEFIAELGAIQLQELFGMDVDEDQHRAYIQSWVEYYAEHVTETEIAPGVERANAEARAAVAYLLDLAGMSDLLTEPV